MVAALFAAAFFVSSPNAKAADPAPVTATANATVTGGSLTIGTVIFPNYPSVQLDGTDKTVTSNFTVPVTDARGDSSAGWKLQANIDGPLKSTATTLDTIPAIGHTIISAGTTVTTSGSTPSDNSSRFNATTNATQIPVVPDSPLLIFSNAAGSGMGTSTESFGTSLTIPANTVAHADYTATLTVSLVTGP
jgi:hypothetical protein